MKVFSVRAIFCFILLVFLSACTRAPRSEQVLGTAAGAGIGGGTLALLHAPKPLMIAGAVIGGAIGYYVTSPQFEERNITAAGGQVYQIGQRVGIDIPSTSLFDTERSEFLSTAPVVLSSVVEVLSHFPNHRIVVTAHTNGADRMMRERPLSVRQADAVLFYLKRHGISAYRGESIVQRSMRAEGRAFDAPISNHITLKGIRENAHIHIMAYPNIEDPRVRARRLDMQNIGAFKD